MIKEMSNVSRLSYSDFSSKLEEYKNGRVILNDNKNYIPYESHVGSSQKQKCFGNSIRSIHQATSLSETFFSRENADIIHQEIIKRVYRQTGNVISRQSDTNLEIIMRSIYLQYGKNLPCQIKEQVIELNEEVIKECLKIIVPNIQQTIGYRRDLTQLPTTINRPINVSSKGTKMLHDKIGFY